MIAMAILFISTKSKFTEAAKVKASIEQYKGMLEEKEKRVRNISQDKKELEELVVQFTKVKDSFFTYDQAMDYVINNLTAMVKNNNINYTALNIKPVKLLDESVSDFSITLDVDGPYTNLRRFIDQLENSDRAIYLDDYVITARSILPVNVGTNLVIHFMFMAKNEKQGPNE